MAKGHKVKRYYGEKATVFRARPRPITIAFLVLLFAGLGYLGTVIYEPAYEFIMGIGRQAEPVRPEPESLASEAPSQQQAEPAPETKQKPEYSEFRAVYAPHLIVSDTARFDIFLDGLDFSAVNTVMIDIKNLEGDILFRSNNETAAKWGLISPSAVDLGAIAKKLEDRGLMLAVKMSVFRDPRAASAGRLEYAINYQNSNYLWLDNSAENGGKPWLNPYSSLTRAYIEALMSEAIDSGARLVALENVRFPDNSAIYASFGSEAQGVSRSQMLKSVISELSEKAEEKNARVAAYFPVTEASNTELQENRYGGRILDTVGEFVMPGVQPSLFGEGYNANGLEIIVPKADPAAAVTTALNYINAGIPDVTLMPVLEGGNKELTASQIAAVKEMGIEEYVLYSEEGEYEF